MGEPGDRARQKRTQVVCTVGQNWPGSAT